MQGYVKKWTDRGYGFIKSQDGTEYFVHFSNIIMDGYKKLEQDQEVEFDVESTPKGLQAVNVKIKEEN